MGRMTEGDNEFQEIEDKLQALTCWFYLDPKAKEDIVKVCHEEIERERTEYYSFAIEEAVEIGEGMKKDLVVEDNTISIGNISLVADSVSRSKAIEDYQSALRSLIVAE